jgi:hypothetical protein
MRNTYHIVVGKARRRSRRSWEKDIRMDHRETGWEDVDWMHLP